MMAVGETFCMLCDKVIPELERRFVMKSLAKDKLVISISIEQMPHFCGNILQLETVNGDKVIAMSQSAYDAFSPAQRHQLAMHGKLPVDASTIESIGSGSVRCMLGEVFLPSRQAVYKQYCSALSANVGDGHSLLSNTKPAVSTYSISQE